MRSRILGVLGLAACSMLAGCQDVKKYKTTVELTRVHAFGKDPKEPSSMDVELRYSECPGEARKLVRGDKVFAKCGLKLHVGEKVPVDVIRTYDSDRGVYRSEVTRIGECDIKTDPKDEANYEVVENCAELKATGSVVGVHCGRRRDKALTDKCPWLRRN
jgi:hypothetical protein